MLANRFALGQIVMYPLANMLIQIKNAQAVGHEKVLVPFSKIKLSVLETLKGEGFVENFEKKKKKAKKSELNYIDVKLKYENGRGIIKGLKLISKPSRRIYMGKSELKPVMNGYGFLVVTTPKGVMTGRRARKEGVGGEVLFEIW